MLPGILRLSLPILILSNCKTTGPASTGDVKVSPYTPPTTTTNVPPQIPDEAWQEVLDVGLTNPSKVIIFKNGRGGISAINVDNAGAISNLDDPFWPKYHKCLQQREYRNADQRRRLYVRCSIKPSPSCRGPLEVFVHDSTWANGDPNNVVDNRLTRFAGGIDEDLHLQGYSLTFDPSHSPTDNFAAVVTTEDGIIIRENVDGKPEFGKSKTKNGHEEIWIVETVNSRDWDKMRKWKVTEQDGSFNQKQPTWSPDGRKIVYSTNMGTKRYHLRILHNPMEDHTANRGLYKFSDLTDPNVQDNFTDPVWIKYRDLPVDDFHCKGQFTQQN